MDLGSLTSRSAVVALGWLATKGCADEVPEASAERPFETVAEVQLQEVPDDPIVGVGFVSRRPDGGFALADEAADRVRLFDDSGAIDRTLGRSGEGPGEFDAPTAVVEAPDGTVLVTQRSSPRLTIFRPGEEPLLRDVPGHYGYWASSIGDRLIVGMGSRAERFAVMSRAGEHISSFGVLPSAVNDTPYWIYFARQHATVVGDRIVTNTSFFPTLHVFDAQGDSITSFGEPPPSWVAPTGPPVDRLSDDGDRERIEEWSRSFTVVRGIATVADSLIVVQYGRHDPTENDPYRVVPATIDVYSLSGERVVEDLALTDPIAGGGTNLLVLSDEPPGPWTLSVLRWRGAGR